MKRLRQFMITTAALMVIGQTSYNAAHAQRLVPPADVIQPSPATGWNNAPAQPVQSVDPTFRLNQLEEEVRRLNGRVEELNFQLLQMIEKLRKMEEDNELRFQEIEEKQSSDGTDDGDSSDLADAGDSGLEKPEPSGENSSTDGQNASDESDAVDPSEPRRQKGSLPRALGTLTFDEQGNVIDNDPTGTPQLDGPDTPFGQPSQGVEAAEFGATPKDVFAVGDAALSARDYAKGEAVFQAFLNAWPKDPAAGEARYKLGESLFWQKKYYEAANVHLDTHRDFPNAKTAPENLLGLGLALAGLNQREVACATYAEVLQQYPKAAPRLAERIKDEQAGARC